MNRRLYSFGPFQLNTSEQLLLRDGQALPLKPKVFEVLAVLVQNSGRVVSKDALMKQVWSDSFVEEGNLAVCVFEIRKALGADENGHRYIETVPRRGYRFVACVTEEAPSMTSQQGFDIALPPMTVIGNSGRSESSDKPTIAVLPFKSIGANANRFLGLGLAEALVTKLSGLSQVTVRPTSSARKEYAAQDQAAIGKELNVEWVLDGSVQKVGKRIRVMVQLVNVGDCVLHWAEKFDEEFTDVFAVEDSISEQVVNALALKLTSKDRRMLAKRPSESVEAYEAYLKGQYFYDKRTAEGCNKGIQYLEEAIKADPKFALAYVGLADCYDWLRTSNAISRAEANLKTESAILKALELDSELAVAHSALGMLRTRQWDWSTADREFRKAIDLNPRFERVHSGYAIFLLEMGRVDDALAEIKRAQKLNPLSLSINVIIGSVLYFTRQYDKAVEQAYRTLELADFPLAHVCLGYAYEAQGKYMEALAAFRQARRGLRVGAELPTCFARIHALTGRKDKALQAIHQLSRQPKKYGLTANSIALIYAALGDADQAFMWLERAYTEHDDDLALLKIDPRWDGARGDSRFLSLLERVGLAD